MKMLGVHQYENAVAAMLAAELFFEKYFGIGGSSTFTEENQEKVTYDIEVMTELQMGADNTYEKKL